MKITNDPTIIMRDIALKAFKGISVPNIRFQIRKFEEMPSNHFVEPFIDKIKSTVLFEIKTTFDSDLQMVPEVNLLQEVIKVEAGVACFGVFQYGDEYLLLNRASPHVFILPKEHPNAVIRISISDTHKVYLCQPGIEIDLKAEEARIKEDQAKRIKDKQALKDQIKKLAEAAQKQSKTLPKKDGEDLVLQFPSGQIVRLKDNASIKIVNGKSPTIFLGEINFAQLNPTQEDVLYLSNAINQQLMSLLIQQPTSKECKDIGPNLQ